jgi:hypothetical protein
MDMSLKLMKPVEVEQADSDSAIETLLLTDEQIAYIDETSKDLNPEMPSAFGWPHAVRTLLERFEESDIDLTAADSEDGIVRVAAAQLRKGSRQP